MGSHKVTELVILDRHNLYNSFKNGMELTFEEALTKDNDYKLFRSEDWPAWVAFTAVFAVLITFDNVVLHRNPQALTIGKAVVYTLFWILCACGFCCGVYWHYGAASAWMWMSGYMLEWMLSFDNLFIFHLIFTIYGTPDEQKHRPLFLGICGAVFFRLAFIFVGEYLMHTMFFMHLVFGAFLVYSGIKTITADEDDEDPSKNALVQWLQQRVPFVSVYDKNGAFLVRVPDGSSATCKPGEVDALKDAASETGQATEIKGRYGTVDFSAAAMTKFPNGVPARGRKSGQLRATMLFLVLICLEVSDVLFAVDSVSAIVAQVNDLFLAYTSAIFAMLGLRATFFIIDELVRLFSLLKYGVAAVLVFIGVKLMISRVYHISPGVVCMVLVCSLAGSMVASLIHDRIEQQREQVQQFRRP